MSDSGTGAPRRLRVNQLLRFRSLAALYQLDDGGWALLLDEVLAQPPSPEAWTAVYELFVSWPEGSSKAQHLERADQQLASWNPKLRMATTWRRSLIDSGQLASVARLARAIEIDRRDDHGSGELEAIARSPYASQLTQLFINRSNIGKHAWQLAIRSPHLTHLTQVTIRRTMVRSEDLSDLFNASSWSRLRDLSLIEVCVRPKLEYPSGVSAFPELRCVDLSGNHLGDEAALALLQAPWLSSVEELRLCDNGLSVQSLAPLLEKKPGVPLKVMDGSNNHISASDAEALNAIARPRNISLSV